MYRNKLFVTVLSGALAAGTFLTGAVLAGAKEPHHRPNRGEQGMMHVPQGEAWRDIAFVRMLKQFDTDHDGKISKNEGTAGVEKIFDAIDANHDGSITPGELREYREAEMKKMREARKADDAAPASSGDQQAAADAGRSDGIEHQRWEGRRHGEGGKGMRHGGMMMAGMMRQVDTDENGQISKQEASAAFDRFFAKMDTNKDGFISIDDLPDRAFL